VLTDLRLPGISRAWQAFTERADTEGWPASRLLAALAEFEVAERETRRMQRHLTEARLPPGKTLDTFDSTAVPMVSKARVMALVAGDVWLKKGANLTLFGGPGGGKSQLAAAIGAGLIENGWRVLFMRNTDLFRNCKPPAAITISKGRSPSSTSIIRWCSTTWRM
jgi:DNA replication protein DnaC